VVDVELGSGMGKKGNLWACAAMCILKNSGSGISINVELSGGGKIFIGGLSVLMALDVLNSG
jgi:hypothetical protein